MPLLQVRQLRSSALLNAVARDDRWAVRRTGVVFGFVALLACAVLAGLAERSAPVLAASVGVALGIWVGIASLFSP